MADMHPLLNKQCRAFKRGILLFVLFFGCFNYVKAQENAILYNHDPDSLLTAKFTAARKATHDSLQAIEDDTLKFYRKIKHFAQKNHYLELLYEATFRNPEPKPYVEEPESKEEKNVNPFIAYQRQVIRNIDIIVYDPFGHSVNDTIYRKVDYSQRAGNIAHMRSRRWVISNRLLFKKNDTINPLAISETERLLRSAVFINDAKITIESTGNKDSVDVRVVVLDKWSITVPVLITDVSGNVKFRNQNLFGLGQQFEQYIGFRRPNVLDFNGYYNIENIHGTYISSRLAYQATITGTQVGVSFNRGFFSPLTPWAGGVSFYNTWNNFGYTDAIDSTSKSFQTYAINYDVWAGRAFKLSKDRSFFSQSTNIIAAWRFYNNSYIHRPTLAMDPGRAIFNTTAALGNIGFAVQQYYKDKFIYRFGANEDVPEGFIFQYIYGAIQKQYDKIRYYSGIEVARSKHFKFGYVSATFSYGVFFNKGVSNDITANFNMYYFSNLRRSGRWYFRQFIYYNTVYGANKLFNETITLSSNELYGFNPGTLSGTAKMVINSETVAYAPYNFIGFRFAPVVLAGFGLIGDSHHRFIEGNLYQGYAAGIMVRNENLVSSTFQFTFGYYPFLPNGDKSVWAYNPVTSFTLRVRAFSVSRPEFVSY